MANYSPMPQDSVADAAGSPATITQRVYSILYHEIINGDLRPGDRLVRRTISKRLGVSPIPVLESLLRLESDGLVVSEPLYGSRVSPMSYERFYSDDILREAIECQAARLVAELATEEQLSKLLTDAKVLDRNMRQDSNELSKRPQTSIGVQLHQELHIDIAKATGVHFMAEELLRIWRRHFMHLKWVRGGPFERESDDWHQRLIQALLTRDPDFAERRMREHCQHNRENHLESLKRLLGQ